VAAPELTLERCLSLATAVATYSDQQVNQERPLLAATLPTGERTQFVIPPAVTRGTVSITIRKPSDLIKRLDDFEREGLFERTATVTAKSLLEACLRMRPDRIFLAEVRGDECFSFIRLAASGHPGSITSVHAGSCALAFEQMALMIRESGAGGGLRMDEIKWLLGVVVDVIVQFDRDERGRFVSEIFYEPRRQLLARWDDAFPEAASAPSPPFRRR